MSTSIWIVIVTGIVAELHAVMYGMYSTFTQLERRCILKKLDTTSWQIDTTSWHYLDSRVRQHPSCAAPGPGKF